jgi:hypothetical protein
MFARLNRLGDRLLSALVPSATAAAGCTYIGDVGGGCYWQCCSSGTRVRKEECCATRPCRTVGEC